MKQLHTEPKTKAAIYPIAIACFTVVLLAIGWVAGYKTAIKSSNQAWNRKLEERVKHVIKQHQINVNGYGVAMGTNELIRKFKFDSSEAFKQTCNEQVLYNTFLISMFKNDHLMPDYGQYEVWKSLELLGIKSAKEFQLRFNASTAYDRLRDYFVDRVDGQEHYSRLLKLVDTALRDDDKYRQLNKVLVERQNSGG